MNDTMRVFGADETRAALPFAALIATLRETFGRDISAPVRHHHDLPQADGAIATLLLMPAWERGGFLGTKIVTVHPRNADEGSPSVYSTYMLADEASGRPLAIMDGNEITARRTVAISALAASLIARQASQTLLLVGAGRIAALLPEAMREVLPIRQVLVWNKRPARAEDLVRTLIEQGIDAQLAPSLREAVASSDIVSCATLSTAPLVEGAWVRPGTHVDLVGGFTPTMREVDDQCIANARIFIDTPAATSEAGDLSQPLAAGLIKPADILATLADLCAGRFRGRQNDKEITLFKSVGTALSDLAAGALAYRALGAGASQ